MTRTQPRRRGRPRQVLGLPNQRTSTRDALVREGVRALSQRGWDAVGVQGVLEAAGVPKGSFYHYFPSKEVFGLEVIADYERTIGRRLARTLEAEGRADERIAGFVLAGRRAMESGRFRCGCVVGNMAQELGTAGGALPAALKQIWRRWEHALRGCLREGVAQRLWPAGLDVEAAAALFWAGWQGAILSAKLARSPRAIDDFARTFLAGLAAGVPARPSLLVTFGLPGAGKTFVAGRLKSRGFHLHDGDDDLPADMRDAIAQARPVTPEMRDRFMAALREHVAALRLVHPRLVVAQTFLKQAHRREFARCFPEARFVLVTASASVRAARLSGRINQPLHAASVRTMIAAFDSPVAPFARLSNTGDDGQLDRALDALVAEARGRRAAHPSRFM